MLNYSGIEYCDRLEDVRKSVFNEVCAKIFSRKIMVII